MLLGMDHAYTERGWGNLHTNVYRKFLYKHAPVTCTVSHSYSQTKIFFQETAVSEQPCPKLDSNDTKDEEDKKAEKENIPQHGKCV